jgi:hypothetical protein
LGDIRNGGYDRDGKCTQYCISFHDCSIFVTRSYQSAEFVKVPTLHQYFAR